ncbi:polysaccharide deacetylase family protein [Candidatus Acetothermia bacterium]|nr:polysaccharide deacetylase family protein [Candidatus Acetothermia bacterium]MBI3643982.1 polysaccharide deacetylase family protein [Candidatus Acetothermia bacterium]
MPLDRWEIPKDLLSCTEANEESLPVIYGQKLSKRSFYESTGTSTKLGIDIFGSAFFILTRYEEIIKSVRDHFDRFLFSASLAYKEGFLERPIVNEYLDLLWALLKRIWPSLKRKERDYRFVLSHDVDDPAWVAGKSWPTVLRNTAGDVLRRHELGMAWHRFRTRIQTGYDRYERDPAYQFDFIMSLSEQLEVKSAFNFISERTAGEIDGYYDLRSPWIRRLLKAIHKRGHEIGLHTSFQTYLDPKQIKKEFEKLRMVCASEGIEQQAWGGRQHFLRWKGPVTWQGWEDAGLTYDSTLAFSGHIGFRCGTCYEYPVYNLNTRKQLELLERPLVALDRTLFDYMKLSEEEAMKRIFDLALVCKAHRGDFTLLWHNNDLLTQQQREFYRSVAAGCV